MIQLFNDIPDIEVVLAMSPEELGSKLLGYLKTTYPAGIRPRDQQINIGNLILGVPIDVHGDGRGGYPRVCRDELQVAFSEALSWLVNEGLLVPKPESSSWYCISRRARGFPSEQAVVDYARSAKLPRELLHKDLSGDVWLSYLRGDFATAIFQAMRAVEIDVREAGGFSNSDVGVPLMRSAFNKETGPLSDLSQEVAEREALSSLFAGAIGSYKNPHSHRDVSMDDPIETLEVILLANHLLRIVDSRKSQNVSRQ